MVGKEMEVLCIGGGFGGLLSAARMKMKGIEDVWVAERGSGQASFWAARWEADQLLLAGRRAWW